MKVRLGWIKLCQFKQLPGAPYLNLKFLIRLAGCLWSTFFKICQYSDGLKVMFLEHIFKKICPID
jgi:hypothetical protein